MAPDRTGANRGPREHALLRELKLCAGDDRLTRSCPARRPASNGKQSVHDDYFPNSPHLFKVNRFIAMSRPSESDAIERVLKLLQSPVAWCRRERRSLPRPAACLAPASTFPAESSGGSPGPACQFLI